MQLVYFWINQSRNGFIKEQGFNLYGEYCFNVEVTGDKYRLTLLKKDVIGSALFEGSGVKNVTAIVGENGSGKSTILNTIQNLRLSKHNKDLNVDYEIYIERQESVYYNICVYLNKYGEFLIYDNLAENTLEIEGIDNVKFHHSISEIDEVESETASASFNALQSKVYLTNSNYTSTYLPFDFQNGKLDGCPLTPNHIKLISSNFFRKICNHYSNHQSNICLSYFLSPCILA